MNKKLNCLKYNGILPVIGIRNTCMSVKYKCELIICTKIVKSVHMLCLMYLVG